jgi:uncharacterized protein (DUF697 family)
MNQTEIFQNMSELPWLPIPFSALIESIPNRAAMIGAAHETYGKGINPESVEKMYRALDKIRTDIGKYSLEEQFGLQDDYIQEALNAAKL